MQLVFRGAQRARVRREKTTRGPYVLSGMVRCAVCGRRMQGSWNNNQPYYRCKFPTEYAVSEEQHAKTIYVREASILPPVDEWLAGLFSDDHIDETCAAVEATFRPDATTAAVEISARRKLKECDAKLATYRQALEAGTDPTIVSGWIEEVKLERKAAELQLRRKRGDGRMTREEIRSVVEQLKGIVAMLNNADPEDRRAVYQELNVSITYHTDGRLHVKAGPKPCTNDGVGGATSTVSTYDHWQSWLAIT